MLRAVILIDQTLVRGNLFNDFPLLILPQHQTYARNSSYLFGLELCVATCDDDEGPGMLANELMYGLPTLVIGHLGDTAGVDDANISDLTRLHLLHTSSGELTRDGGRFGEVELAP